MALKREICFREIGIFLLIFVAVLFYTCQPEKTETPIKGNLKVYTDISLYPITKRLADEFQSLYRNAKLEVIPLLTNMGIAKIINDDSCSIFISSREFNKEEKEIIQKNNLPIRTLNFLFDGIVLIGNKKSSIDSLTKEDLTQYLLQKKYSGKIVMPYKNSGIYDAIKDNFLMGKDPEAPEFVTDELDVIKIVKNNPDKLGLVGRNLINDSSDVKMLRLGKLSAVTMEVVFYDTHPAYLFQKSYPLTRKCVIFLRENYVGIAGGFSTFITFTDGQKIVLENNLAPAAVPVKLKSNY